jgi:hypothetical protein
METSDIPTQKEIRDSANAELTMITFPWLSRTIHWTLWGNVFQNKQWDSWITSGSCEINSKHWGQLSLTRYWVFAWQRSFSYCWNTTAIVVQRPWNIHHTVLTSYWGLLFVWTLSYASTGCPLVANHDLKGAVHVCIATWLHTKA